MRVTANTFSQTLLNQVGRLTVRQNRLQNQAATGQRVQLPEDDPAAMRRALELQGEFKALGQYRNNVARLGEQAGATFNAMKSLKRVSDRAGEIAVLADGSKSPEQLAIFASEVSQLLEQAVQLGNSKHGGNFLFGGTRSDQKPFTATTDSSGRITAVAYNGNTSTPEVEIAESVTLSTQVLGANTTGSGPRGLLADSRDGVDFFGHLISLQNHLLAADTAAISATDQPALAKDEESFLFQYGANGSLQARLEASKSLLEGRSASVESLVSNEVDADLAATLVQLNQTQNAYRAALQSGGTILNLSILDYLR